MYDKIPNFPENFLNENLPRATEVNEKNEKTLGKFHSYFKENSIPQNKSKSYKLPLLVAVVVIVAFCVTCLCIDVQNFRKENYFQLNLVSNTHENAVQNTDGTYTTVGLAEAVTPSIAELYSYNDEVSTDTYNGQATGIILTEDGYILTNCHCVDDSTKVEIVTHTGDRYIAEIVGKDSKTDIAVLKIPANNLTPAIIANSNNVVLGEKVCAVGNSGGFPNSVTDGIISGVKRIVRNSVKEKEMECFQTNAEISPGNSGGALVNMYGEVIGMTTSKIAGSAYEGLGFAITSNAFTPIVEEIISKGYVSDRYRLGVTLGNAYYYNVQDQFSEEKGFPLPEDIDGVIVFEIDADCNIAESELEIYDIIVEMNGEKIEFLEDIYPVTENVNDKTPITVKVKRYTAEEEFTYQTFDIYLTQDKSGNF